MRGFCPPKSSNWGRSLNAYALIPRTTRRGLHRLRNLFLLLPEPGAITVYAPKPKAKAVAPCQSEYGQLVKVSAVIRAPSSRAVAALRISITPASEIAEARRSTSRRSRNFSAS